MAGPDSPINRDATKGFDPLLGGPLEPAPANGPSSLNKHGLPAPFGEMAQHDLDAALQLLAERAQYITGASGAAIALRRGLHRDMLCRASAGASAPDLGTLLSMEYGFTGESVRTGQTLFCKDAETDSRVNREGCRQLGIASVIAMPIMSGKKALGVFELFSGKASAFAERDFAALRRLSEMVETAIRHAEASPATQETAENEAAGQHERVVVEKVANDSAAAQETSRPSKAVASAVSTSVSKPAPEANAEVEQKANSELVLPAERISAKPRYWSVATQQQSGQPPIPDTSESLPVPAILRDLKKCQACGFPVSQGRTFCVECEEKQWRGHAVGKPKTAGQIEALQPSVRQNERSMPDKASAQDVGAPRGSPNSIAVAATDPPPDTETKTPAPTGGGLRDSENSDSAELFLSVAAQPESWLAANKFVISALLLVAITIAAIAWLR